MAILICNDYDNFNNDEEEEDDDNNNNNNNDKDNYTDAAGDDNVMIMIIPMMIMDNDYSMQRKPCDHPHLYQMRQRLPFTNWTCNLQATADAVPAVVEPPPKLGNM